MSHSKKLEGILVAVTTPFSADAAQVDFATLKSEADRLIAAGIHGLVCTGTTGEFTTLSDEEYKAVIKAYVDASAGRVPVIAGIGALSTQKAIELAQHSEAVGADAIMLVPPFYDPLSFETLKVFMASVAGSIDIPVVYYNVPGATGIKLSADQIAELGEIKGVDYLKDTSGDAVELAALLASKTDKIKAFNGWDTLTFFGITSGAEASVWGAAGVAPELAAGLWQALAVEKDLDKGRELWKSLWEISSFLESVNYVAGIKAGLELLGHPVGPARLPILPIGEAEKSEFRSILNRAGLLAS